MKSMSIAMFSAAYSLIVAAGAAGQTQLQKYQLVSLPPLPGATESRAEAINNAGLIAGSSNGTTRIASIWTEIGVPTALGVLPGATSSEAKDINDLGETLFRSSGHPGTQWYVLSPKSIFEPLPIPSGFDSVSAGAINSYGEVVGTAEFNGSNTGLIWKPTPSGISVELFPSVEDSFVTGTAINDSGLAAYAIFTSFGNTSVVDRRTGDIDTSNTGAQVAVVEDINNAGRALVVADIEGKVLETYITGVGSVLPLGCSSSNPLCQDFGDGNIGGLAINESGLVVGGSQTVEFDDDGFPIGDNGMNEAFVWSQDTGTQRLIDHVVEGDTVGWFFENAVDINDSGWIVGNGTLNGESRAFLLIPREPCAGDVNRDGEVTPTDFTAWINAFNSGCD